MRNKKWTFGVSRIKLNPTLVNRIEKICEPMAISLVQENHNDVTGEGYRHYFYLYDSGYPENNNRVERLYQAFKNAEIELP